jgi:signal transduction histidine kinase
MQIRTRLTLLFLLLAAGILAAVLFGVYWLFKKNTEETFYKGLASNIELTVRTVLNNETALSPTPNNWVAPEEGDTLPYVDNISIFDNAYTRVFSIRQEAVPVNARDLELTFQTGEIRFMHYNHHALGKKINSPRAQFAIIAEGYCDPTEVIQLRNILIYSFLIGMFLVAISGWYYAGKALEPMSQIVQEVDNIQPSDLSRRVASSGSQDELAHMAKTFNNLLDRVERAFQMQRMFVSNVSHELKNPLTAIRAQLDVALQRDREPEVYRKALQSVLDDILDLSEMEQKLLQLARVYNSAQNIQRSPTRLDELLWQSLEQFQKQHPGYQAQIQLGDMPESGESLLVEANEPLLRLALLNLMSNACKYSPDHKVMLRAMFKPGGNHEIAVCDNGPGIPEAEKALIFEPFYRSPRHLQVKGTGIGLSLVISILNLHQITLSVESPAEGGTVFRLVFP